MNLNRAQIVGFHEAAHALILIVWPKAVLRVQNFHAGSTGEEDFEPKIRTIPPPPCSKADADALSLSSEERKWVAKMYAAGYAGECIARNKPVIVLQNCTEPESIKHDKACLEEIEGPGTFYRYAGEAYHILKIHEKSLALMAERISQHLPGTVSGEDLETLFQEGQRA